MLNEQARWDAVLRRDAAADGKFVYAVRSTGVFCRPSCPSRRPSREQVRFFDAPAGAQSAGFRPCRRCRPLDERSDLAMVREVTDYIARRLDERITLAALAGHTGVSPFHLQRTFKRTTGMSPRAYAESLRVQAFKGSLQQGDTVTSAVYEAGFSGPGRAYERAASRLGMTPATYRKGGAGARIAFTIQDCPVGRLLVAATPRGVCAVIPGDTDDEVEQRLRSEFPKAAIHRGGQGVARWAAAVREHFEGLPQPPAVPLDIRATAFEWHVWEALRAIPRGASRSYRQVAEAIGRPKAVRAVAQACGANPVAVVIPCHRVVRQDGTSGGYRWGVERKLALRRAERDAPAGA